MKKLTSIFLVLVLLLPVLPTMAEYTAADAYPDALAENYSGDWICAYGEVNGKVFEAESNLETLGMDSLLTLRIEDGTASFTGIKELGTDPMPLTFADGAMLFQPEEGVTVLTLQLLQDDVISMKFNMIPFGPTLYLVRVTGSAIDCRFENGGYIISIPIEENDKGWFAESLDDTVRLAGSEIENGSAVFRFEAVADGEATISVRHYYIACACDAAHTWDLTVKDGAIQECTGGSYTAAPQEKELDAFMSGEWLEDETQFTKMIVTKNELMGWDVEIVSPMTHGAFEFLATVYYDCWQDAFVYDTGMLYDLPAEADGARVEPAVTGSAGCMQFEAVNEEKTVLHWIDDAIQAGDVYFVRADAE